MKKKVLLSILIIITFLTGIIPTSQVKASVPSIPPVQAHAYIVMDANSGEIILKQNATKKIYPASTAKLMTAIVALESNKINKRFITSNSVLKKIPSDAASLKLPYGVSYSFSSLLHMLLIASAADAAETLAVGTYGSTSNFIHQMNTKAKELSMNHTNFDNTIGLDIGNHYYHTYTTASDFAILARYAMSKKEIRDIVAKKSYIIPKTSKSKAKKIKSTNQFYLNAPYSKDLYKIIGTKTGTTNAAGNVLIATATDKYGHEVLCAFFGNSTRSNLYSDVKKLLDYTFTQNQNGNLTLSKGFYDTRYTKTESLIRDYYNKGLISESKDGQFHPKNKVTQSSFVTIVNNISKSKLTTINKTKSITILDLAYILDNVYPYTLTKKEYDCLINKFTSKTKLSTANRKKLATLYHSNILPDKFTYNVDTYLTKETMIIIAHKMISFMKNYKIPSSVPFVSHGAISP